MNLNVPDLLLSIVEFPRIHPLIANLFPTTTKQLPCAGRVKFFVENWKKLTNDQRILEIVKGYEIPFSEPPKQSAPPKQICLNEKETKLVDQEVQEMLRKGAITIAKDSKGQYVSSLFLVGK